MVPKGERRQRLRNAAATRIGKRSSAWSFGRGGVNVVRATLRLAGPRRSRREVRQAAEAWGEKPQSAVGDISSTHRSIIPTSA
jgi:hypothetical protein